MKFESLISISSVYNDCPVHRFIKILPIYVCHCEVPFNETISCFRGDCFVVSLLAMTGLYVNIFMKRNTSRLET